SELSMDVHLLDRVVGMGADAKVEPLRKNEALMLNVNSCTTVGMVTHLSKKDVKCALKLPICAAKGDRVTISRRVENRFRLIGYGILQ
ncbi:MAG: translation initiation factor IF-2 subunit gamma, partial [Candidatus Woesearchaeota archaeon]